MLYIGILAGGEKRIGKNNFPIQFMKLGNKPLIVHTIEQFLMNKNQKKIIVVVPENHLVYAEDLLFKYIDKENIHIITGGADKSKSIKKIADYIEMEFGIEENDILINHDAIRPFITQRIIEDNISLSKNYEAISTVMPTIDTVIYSEDGIVVSDVPNTGNVFIEQTPLTFNLQKFKEFIDNIPMNEWKDEIDLPRLYTKKDKKFHLIRGEFFNNKLSTEYDLEVASALIKERGK